MPSGIGVGGGGLGFGARHCRAKGPNGILVVLQMKTMLKYVVFNYADVRSASRILQFQWCWRREA
jgi:hypothetical protein